MTRPSLAGFNPPGDTITEQEEDLAQATAVPTDEDWNATNYRYLALLGRMISAHNAVNTNAMMLDDAMQGLNQTIPDGEIKSMGDVGEYHKRLADRLRKVGTDAEAVSQKWSVLSIDLKFYVETSSAALQGAGLSDVVTRNNIQYIVLTKYPGYGVNTETGEVKELGPITTQISH